MKAQRHARAATVATLYRRERGVVLIITLIMLVVMSLAGIAVVRSVDATSAVAGNLALRQASIEPANLAAETHGNHLPAFGVVAKPRRVRHAELPEHLARLADVITLSIEVEGPQVVAGGDQPAGRLRFRVAVTRLGRAAD